MIVDFLKIKSYNRERSDRDRERNRANNKNYKEKKLAGSYATKESRPNRSKGHEMFPERPKKQQPVKEIVRPTSVQVGHTINVKEFSQLIKRDVSEVIKKLFLMGMMVTINQDIDFDTAVLIGDEFGCEVNPEAPEVDLTEVPEVEDDHVLGHFSQDERKSVDEAIADCIEATKLMIGYEVDEAMNRFNSKKK